MKLDQAEYENHKCMSGLILPADQLTTITLELTPDEREKLDELAETCDEGSDGYGNCGWQSPVMKSLASKIRGKI